MSETEAYVLALAKRLPKADLHLHLDGSLPESFLSTRAFARNRTLPCPARELRSYFLVQKASLLTTNSYTQPRAGNWPAFSFCNTFLQTSAELRETFSVVTPLFCEHLCWVVELRFCPTLHLHEGLSENEAIAAVVSGFADASRAAPHPVRGGVLLCALRSYEPSHTEGIARLALHWQNRGVVGMDLAGDEASYPLELHRAALEDAVEAGVSLTLHAGENGPQRKLNIETAVHIGAKRIGHALALQGDAALCGILSQKKVYVETCLTANCTGGGKVPSDRFDLHPAKEMLENGVSVSGFSSDNLLLSGTLQNRPDPTQEIVRARLGCGLSWRQIRDVLVDGAKSSFDDMASPKEAAEFVTRFAARVDHVLEPVLANT